MKLKLYSTVTLFFITASLTFGQELTKLYEKVSPSVVQIIVKSETSKGIGDPYEMVVSGGMGTGVLMSKDGDIVTAAHVVANASEIEIVYKTGEHVSASIEVVSNIGDVALLKASRVPANAVIAKFGNSDKVKIGSKIFVIGFPMGLNYSLSTGVVSGYHKQEIKLGKGIKIESFQTDASINTGNSGGPMFNYKGEVIGIVSSILTKSGGFEGIGFAATSNLAKNLLYKGDHFWFGVDGTFISGIIAEILNLPQDGGFLVSSVTPSSPAYFLGIRGGYLKSTIGRQEFLVGGDIILSIDNIKIDSIESVTKAWEVLRNKKQYETVTFKVLRSGSVKEYSWKIR